MTSEKAKRLMPASSEAVSKRQKPPGVEHRGQFLAQLFRLRFGYSKTARDRVRDVQRVFIASKQNHCKFH